MTTSKQARRARKKARRLGDLIMVICDECGLEQPLRNGHADAPDECSDCGCLYGVYA